MHIKEYLNLSPLWKWSMPLHKKVECSSVTCIMFIVKYDRYKTKAKAKASVLRRRNSHTYRTIWTKQRCAVIQIQFVEYKCQKTQKFGKIITTVSGTVGEIGKGWKELLSKAKKNASSQKNPPTGGGPGITPTFERFNVLTYFMITVFKCLYGDIGCNIISTVQLNVTRPSIYKAFIIYGWIAKIMIIFMMLMRALYR